MNEESLFAAALEKPAGAERRAFLDVACGGDLRLQDRLGRLLVADERGDGILDHGPDAAHLLSTPLSPGGQRDTCPEGDGPPAAREADPPGYELAEVVGEGGMGVVYRARHARLDRDVAVKLLHPRLPADGPAARRFLGEARVTAQLQHPGVPPVHDVGTLPDGRPFLVMKLIRGQTLAELLADERADRGRRLAVFEGVCQAVGYAHSRGVIHRDLKPGNIMVGAFAEVQVMDWGLAKVLAGAGGSATPTGGEGNSPAVDSDLGGGDGTRTGSILGTPAFMSPEQAIGAVDRIDARSDVFGLGAILCAVLTGRPPYVGADAPDTCRLAARARLGDAFARLDACGADAGLVELGKRCMAAEPADRPADAGEVARTVAALRAAADARARQAELNLVRVEGEAREQRNRRRARLAVAAAVGLLLAGAAAGTWYADRQAAQRRAETEARHGRNAEAVAGLLDQCEASLRAEQADRAAVALKAAEQRAGDGGADELAGRLDRCRADLGLLRELDAIDTFRWSASEGRVPGTTEIAARWRAALTRSGAVTGEGPTAAAGGWVDGSPIREWVLAALDGWLAYDPSPEVRAVLRATDPDPYREAVRDALAAGEDTAAALLVERPEALTQPGRFAVVIGQLRGVSAARRRAVLEGALRSRPGDLALLLALGDSYPLFRRDVAGERVRWFQAAVAAHPWSAVARNQLGIALWDKGDHDDAITTLRQAIRIDPDHANVYLNLAILLRGKDKMEKTNDRLDDAIAAYREAIRLRPEYAGAHNNLGNTLRVKGDLNGAITHFRKATDLDPNDPRFPHNLGGALKDARDLPGSLAAYRQAIRRDKNFVDALGMLAWVLATGPDGVRDGMEAVGHATKACELTFYKDPNHLDTLAAAHAEAGDFELAVKYERMALVKADGQGGRDRLDLYTRKKPHRDPTLAPREVAPPPRPADR